MAICGDIGQEEMVNMPGGRWAQTLRYPILIWNNAAWVYQRIAFYQSLRILNKPKTIFNHKQWLIKWMNCTAFVGELRKDLKWKWAGKLRNSPKHGYYMLLTIAAPDVHDHRCDREISTALFLPANLWSEAGEFPRTLAVSQDGR